MRWASLTAMLCSGFRRGGSLLRGSGSTRQREGSDYNGKPGNLEGLIPRALFDPSYEYLMLLYLGSF